MSYIHFKTNSELAKNLAKVLGTSVAELDSLNRIQPGNVLPMPVGGWQTYDGDISGDLNDLAKKYGRSSFMYEDFSLTKSSRDYVYYIDNGDNRLGKGDLFVRIVGGNERNIHTKIFDEDTNYSSFQEAANFFTSQVFIGGQVYATDNCIGTSILLQNFGRGLERSGSAYCGLTPNHIWFTHHNGRITAHTSYR